MVHVIKQYRKVNIMASITIKTKEEARQYAIEFQQKASQENYSYGELIQYQNELTKLAKRFRLTKEFKENGII